ncbi:MAG: bifunctional pyr operon transcriptional regulator/uracil phosphoribosyltransferase [Candidatus Raymondbacteria bacterium RifOxyA12_full_50_37]|uniref:Bifunctional protein PyrR n=1 Tax=Candidatus Raymondbacteria bacterium RIFOXYD12_FULL_49_13 TaxID=1817890 RepID=A0A1F7FGV5_UNCRA|nr:MAG: bifunctional pyr operon transcriptional regulator/uracil phosphoribosyltransferase [Candidatus Raymondbacteria bacterium RifOxyA12_full_50_37]OGJ88932.1 MAG: bifunctional pyr operon transcriptional regulator/uracil phosphoribosyltransferase [Candidatus Raymondbacteria bacterium RIFOXYA2_FULL_49_16]OGJ99136.1 MAG: bifunctional pyr operon transcriptional regulator/uracil phosphoribosyltransferase [Candidatus Raymondbacteria bacterium RifOxyC12_full_50_8]OGK05930.1 MAG: bifunctional pyr ope
MKTKEKSTILDTRAMRLVIDRMAHEILERNKSAKNLVVVGMQTRGAIIAGRLAKKIEEMDGRAVPVGALDITLYRDDYRSAFKQPAVQATDIRFSIEGKDVILVDDVLYTGRTARAALDALTDFGRPKTIQFAVLIDRGLREFPIHADYIGKTVPTAKNEEVKVQVTEKDAHDGVWMVELKK